MAGGTAKTMELLTLEEFEHLPDEDSHRLEITRGRVVREPPPGAPHGWYVRRLFGALHAQVEGPGLGVVINETGFLLSADPPTVRQPDLAVIRMEHLPGDGLPERWWPTAPDLAIEVLSPSNSAVEIQEKVLDYLDAGTALVWVLDPYNEILVVHHARRESRTLTRGDDLTADEVLPGFRLPLAELFAPYRPPTGRSGSQ